MSNLTDKRPMTPAEYEEYRQDMENNELREAARLLSHGDNLRKLEASDPIHYRLLRTSLRLHETEMLGEDAASFEGGA